MTAADIRFGLIHRFHDALSNVRLFGQAPSSDRLMDEAFDFAKEHGWDADEDGGFQGLFGNGDTEELLAKGLQWALNELP